MAKPGDQSRALIFLNSPVASYITGHCLWTDGVYLGGVMTDLIPSG